MRHDRLHYITLTGAKCNSKNYRGYNSVGVNDYDMDYDYCSILHYPEGIIERCKITPIKPITCTVKGQKIYEIGQRLGLSEVDKVEINKRYSCEGKYKSYYPTYSY